MAGAMSRPGLAVARGVLIGLVVFLIGTVDKLLIAHHDCARVIAAGCPADLNCVLQALAMRRRL